jgi:membrane protein implicated in regulation of membrane protease activity
MSYAAEWMGGGIVYGIVLLLLIVPEFAAIAVVVATIAVLVVALAALVGLVALAAAALASPYLLVRSVRRCLAQRRTRWIHSPSGIRSRSAAESPAGPGRAHVTAFARDEPNKAGAILEDAARDAA